MSTNETKVSISASDIANYDVVNINSDRDLPVLGDEKTLYNNLKNGDAWIWHGGKYLLMNNAEPGGNVAVAATEVLRRWWHGHLDHRDFFDLMITALGADRAAIDDDFPEGDQMPTVNSDDGAHFRSRMLRLSHKSRTLFEAIKHGDEGHQSWLKAAIEAHMDGKEMPAYVPSANEPVKMTLLGWRLDWPNGGEIGVQRWAGLDDHARKDRMVTNGSAVAVELWGDPARVPSSGPVQEKKVHKVTVDYNPQSIPEAAEYIMKNPGEPFFILLGRDPQAPELVQRWAEDRFNCLKHLPQDELHRQHFKCMEALDIANAMQSYKNANPEIGLPTEVYNQSKGRTLTYMGHGVVLGLPPIPR